MEAFLLGVRARVEAAAVVILQVVDAPGSVGLGVELFVTPGARGKAAAKDSRITRFLLAIFFASHFLLFRSTFSQ